ncbi:MAG: superoxide dismutase, partial [Bacteroidales bacterium]
TLSGEGNLKFNTMEQSNTNKIVFPELPYAYDALEPWIDARTMEIHYDKHHRAYFNNFLAATKGTQAEKMSTEEIFKNISSFPDAVRNNGGGYYNHIMFWNNMAKGLSTPSAEILKVLEKAFGSFEKFKEQFSAAARTRFGSGWAWLYLTPEKNLATGSTPNQDNPLMNISPIKGIPLLTIDVWEHAYYLKYQNRRPEYIDNFWNVVNWQDVEQRYKKSLSL